MWVLCFQAKDISSVQKKVFEDPKSFGEKSPKV